MPMRQAAAGMSESALANTNDERAETFIPTPPSITYWRCVTVRPGDAERKIMQPITKPLPACERDLDDEEVVVLLKQIVR